ncbi:hypothetical protein BKA66DRAFT_448459 [Pyrenochaeta sp. MPI-SDFR-AT-0127]|nr:hypothetical protein BKA66DRAFT_448459 [Pyrenochaeta sp. MPI-SDFR-AT-0127]
MLMVGNKLKLLARGYKGPYTSVSFSIGSNLGSSVALSLHKNPEFAVCVLSRDAEAAKAKRLSSQGIEVVTANNWKPHEYSLALRGAWEIFINIDSDNPEENWKAGKTPTEFHMGKLIVDTAVRAGVKHIQKKIETGTIVNTGWLLENAFDPNVPWLAAADDYEDMVHGVLLNPEEYNGRSIDGVSESMGFAELTATFQKVTGKKAHFVPVNGSSLNSGSAAKTKEVNGLFDLTHALQGNFFNGQPTEHETSRILKQRADKAVDGPETLVGVADSSASMQCRRAI